jgi:hypothetical protein
MVVLPFEWARCVAIVQLNTHDVPFCTGSQPKCPLQLLDLTGKWQGVGWSIAFAAFHTVQVVDQLCAYLLLGKSPETHLGVKALCQTMALVHWLCSNAKTRA